MHLLRPADPGGEDRRQEYREKPSATARIETACQQVCPTGAIIFGDLADQKSEVLRLQRSARAYAILAELNSSRARSTWPESAIRTRNSNQATGSMAVLPA